MPDPRPDTERIEGIAREWRGHLTYHVDYSAASPEWTCQLTYIGVQRNTETGELTTYPANWYAVGPTMLAAAAELLREITEAANPDPPGDES